MVSTIRLHNNIFVSFLVYPPLSILITETSQRNCLPVRLCVAQACNKNPLNTYLHNFLDESVQGILSWRRSKPFLQVFFHSDINFLYLFEINFFRSQSLTCAKFLQHRMAVQGRSYQCTITPDKSLSR